MTTSPNEELFMLRLTSACGRRALVVSRRGEVGEKGYLSGRVAGYLYGDEKG
jgi:hypothetical protein